MLATGVVFLGVVTAYIIHVITGVPIATMVGILSGAVTNTPGLGAAQQTYTETTGLTDPTIATAYAVAYPLGVVGVILSLILFRYLFKIDPKKENQRIDDQDESKLTEAHMFSLEVKNPAIIGKKIVELKELIEKEFVISPGASLNGGVGCTTDRYDAGGKRQAVGGHESKEYRYH